MQERSEAAGREAQAAGHAASVCAKGLKPEPAAGPPWKDAFSAEEVEGGRGELCDLPRWVGFFSIST